MNQKNNRPNTGKGISGGQQKDSRNHTVVSSTDKRVQRKFILQRLRQRPHSTLELRNFGICAPAPRVLELRRQGFDIATTWRHEEDHAGITHRIGVYSLISEKGAQV